MIDRILIPWKELTNPAWKVHKDGLLESPAGRTEFPDYDIHGQMIGTKSYYLDRETVPVEVRHKPNGHTD